MAVEDNEQSIGCKSHRRADRAARQAGKQCPRPFFAGAKRCKLESVLPQAETRRDEVKDAGNEEPCSKDCHSTHHYEQDNGVAPMRKRKRPQGRSRNKPQHGDEVLLARPYAFEHPAHQCPDRRPYLQVSSTFRHLPAITSPNSVACPTSEPQI